MASIHGLIFLMVAANTMVSSHLLSARTSPFPFSPLLAALPLVLVTLSNALLVPILGLESWLDNDKHDEETSLLLVVQMCACAEAAAAALALAVLLVRYFRGDRRRQALEAAAAAAASTSTGVFGIQRLAGGHNLLSTLALSQGAEIDPATDALAAALLDQQIPAYLAAADAEQTLSLLGWFEGKAAISAQQRAAVSAAAGQPFRSNPPATPMDDRSSAVGAMDVSSSMSVSTGAAAGFDSAGNNAAGNNMTSILDTSSMSFASKQPASSIGSPAPPSPFYAVSGAGAMPPSDENNNGSGSAFTGGPRGLIERLLYLQRREIELMMRLDAVTKELVAAAAGTGQTAMPSLLRTTTEELVTLQAAHRELQIRCDGLNDQVGRLEGELARSGTAIAKLKAQLKEERKKRDKLLANLDAQREADAQAEATILMLQGQIASGGRSAATAAVPIAGGGLPMSLPASLSGINAATGALSNPSSMRGPSFIQQLSTSLGVGGGVSAAAAAAATASSASSAAVAMPGPRSQPNSLSGVAATSRGGGAGGIIGGQTSRGSAHTPQGAPSSSSSLGHPSGPGNFGGGGRGNSGQRYPFGELEDKD